MKFSCLAFVGTVVLATVFASCVALPPPIETELPPNFDREAGRTLPMPDWAKDSSFRVPGTSPLAWVEGADGSHYVLSLGRHEKDKNLLLIVESPSGEWNIAWARGRENVALDVGLMLSGVDNRVYFVDDGRLIMVYDPETASCIPVLKTILVGVPPVSAAVPDGQGGFLVRYLAHQPFPSGEPTYGWGLFQRGRLVPVVVP